MRDLSLLLPAEPSSIPRARHAVERLSGAVEDDLLQNLRLLVSEVVTNSVRHAGLSPTDRIDVRFSVDTRTVRVEVRDTGPGFEPPEGPKTMFQENGWGLYLVDKLADRWGVSSDVGTTVWFELDR